MSWDLRRPPDESRRGGAPRGRAPRGRQVPSGRYVVSLTVDRQTFTQDLAVETDPDHPDYRAWEQDAPRLERQELEAAPPGS